MKKRLGVTRVGALLLTIAGLLGGCVSYYTSPLLYGDADAPAHADFVQCLEDNTGYAMIPDYGITHSLHLNNCMRKAGWELTRNTPAWASNYRPVKRAQ
jgi:hypothetical protein